MNNLFQRILKGQNCQKRVQMSRTSTKVFLILGKVFTGLGKVFWLLGKSFKTLGKSLFVRRRSFCVGRGLWKKSHKHTSQMCKGFKWCSVQHLFDGQYPCQTFCFKFVKTISKTFCVFKIYKLKKFLFSNMYYKPAQLHFVLAAAVSDIPAHYQTVLFAPPRSWRVKQGCKRRPLLRVGY